MKHIQYLQYFHHSKNKQKKNQWLMFGEGQEKEGKEQE